MIITRAYIGHSTIDKSALLIIIIALEGVLSCPLLYVYQRTAI